MTIGSALVTGASSGMGAATACLLASQGTTVDLSPVRMTLAVLAKMLARGWGHVVNVASLDAYTAGAAATIAAMP